MRVLIIIMILGICNFATAQSDVDTSELVNEFARVMGFTNQPLVHYITSTKLESVPVVETTDTMSINGEFFKVDAIVYSKNGPDEMLLEDSLMIEVNNSRKSIWVHKVDTSTLKRLNVIPFYSDDLIKNFRNTYVIQKQKLQNGLCKVSLKGKIQPGNPVPVSTTISVVFAEKTLLPQIVTIDAVIRQVVDDEISTALKLQEGGEKMIQVIDGKRFIVRSQTMSVFYKFIETGNTQIAIPKKISSFLEFDKASQKFLGVGDFQDYEITKTF